MVTLQETDIDPETAYVLDCCCDDNTIDAGASVALLLYGDRNRIRDIVENTPVGYSRRDHVFGWRTGISAHLSAYADSLILDLPIETQGLLFGSAMIHIRHLVHSSAEFMADWAIRDMVEGGCSKDYNRPPRSKDEVTPYRKDLRRLHSASWIRRYVKREPELRRWRALADGVIARGRGLPRAALRADVGAFDALRKEQRARIRAQEAIQWARMMGDDDAVQTDNVRVTLKRQVLGHIVREQRRRRAVLKKALRTAVSVVGHDVATSFVRGNPVMLVGDHAAFKIRKYNSAASIGHGALDITLCDKDSHEPLADLCFYIDKTPALDQMTAIGLHVASGDELDILETANIVRVKPAGIGHPLVSSRHSPPGLLENAAIVDAPTQPLQLRPYLGSVEERRRIRGSTYFEKTKPMWIDATGVQVLGPRFNELSIELTGVI